jgi:hypothetical protein
LKSRDLPPYHRFIPNFLATAKNLFSDGDQICLRIALYGMKAVTEEKGGGHENQDECEGWSITHVTLHLDDEIQTRLGRSPLSN